MNSHPKRKFDEVDSTSPPAINIVEADKVIDEIEAFLGLKSNLIQNLENLLGLNDNPVSDAVPEYDLLSCVNQVSSANFAWPENFRELLNKGRDILLWEESPSSYLQDVMNNRFIVMLATFNKLQTAVQHLLAQGDIPDESQKHLENLYEAIEFKKLTISLQDTKSSDKQETATNSQMSENNLEFINAQSNEPYIDFNYEQSMTFHQKLKVLRDAKIKEQFEIIMQSDENIIKWLKGDKFHFSTYANENAISDKELIHYLILALELNVKSSLLFDWIANSPRAQTVLNSAVGMKRRNFALIHYITQTIHHGNVTDDIFLQYLISNITNIKIDLEISTFLNPIIIDSNSPEELRSRAINFMMLINGKKAKIIENQSSSDVRESAIANFSMFTTPTTEALERQEAILYVNKDEMSILAESEKVLRSTSEKSTFEEVWQAHQAQFQKLLKGARIYVAESGFKVTGKSEVQAVFRQMLILKVDATITKQMLVDNSKLIEFINSVEYSNKATVFQYLLSLNNDAKNIDFIKFLINDIVNNETILQYLHHSAIGGLKSNSLTKEQAQVLNVVKDLTDYKLLFLQLDKKDESSSKSLFNNP